MDMLILILTLHCFVAQSQQLVQNYSDESEVSNVLKELVVFPMVDPSIRVNSWERQRTCHFPNANGTIQLEKIREGLWIPLVYLQHADNQLHPFVSPYGPLHCLRVMTRYNPANKWLSLHYGCQMNASFPVRWDFRFEFLPNASIFYRNRYGCNGSRQLRRTVIAATDYENYLLLHGCQSNTSHYLRSEGLMVLVRTLAFGVKVRQTIGNYTQQVLQSPSQLTYLYLTNDGSVASFCNCSAVNDFGFCEPKYRLLRGRSVVARPVNGMNYWTLTLVAVVAHLMATLALVDQLYTFQTTAQQVN